MSHADVLEMYWLLSGSSPQWDPGLLVYKSLKTIRQIVHHVYNKVENPYYEIFDRKETNHVRLSDHQRISTQAANQILSMERTNYQPHLTAAGSGSLVHQWISVVRRCSCQEELPINDFTSNF